MPGKNWLHVNSFAEEETSKFDWKRFKLFGKRFSGVLNQIIFGKLEGLDLGDWEHFSDGLRELSLDGLSIMSANLNGASLQKVCERYFQNHGKQGLARLGLSRNSISTKDVQMLMRSLAHKRDQPMDLNLGHNKIDDTGLKLICGYSFVRHVVITGNMRLGWDGISEYLKTNKCRVQTGVGSDKIDLDLAATGITRNIFQNLVIPFLSRNVECGISCLDFSNNAGLFGDEGRSLKMLFEKVINKLAIGSFTEDCVELCLRNSDLDTTDLKVIAENLQFNKIDTLVVCDSPAIETSFMKSTFLRAIEKENISLFTLNFDDFVGRGGEEQEDCKIQNLLQRNGDIRRILFSSSPTWKRIIKVFSSLITYSARALVIAEATFKFTQLLNDYDATKIMGSIFPPLFSFSDQEDGTKIKRTKTKTKTEFLRLMIEHFLPSQQLLNKIHDKMKKEDYSTQEITKPNNFSFLPVKHFDEQKFLNWVEFVHLEKMCERVMIAFHDNSELFQLCEKNSRENLEYLERLNSEGHPGRWYSYDTSLCEDKTPCDLLEIGKYYVERLKMFKNELNDVKKSGEFSLYDDAGENPEICKRSHDEMEKKG